MESNLGLSLIICTYDDRRFGTLSTAISSALTQTLSADEMIVVVDHNPELLRRVSQEFPEARVVPNCFEAGASGARNAGVAEARGEIIAFLDDDAVADPDWLEHLHGALESEPAAGVGGNIKPLWVMPRPQWFPDSFAWVVGASYKGQPTARTWVRNVWSGSMLVRRHAFDGVGGFRVEFGKKGEVSRPEDTEFCLRVTEAMGHSWIYEPKAVIHHLVPPERATWRFFLRRCVAEGRGKASMSRSMASGSTLQMERSYAASLPKEACHEAAAGLERAGAVILGLIATAVGLVYESVLVEMSHLADLFNRVRHPLRLRHSE